MAYIRSVVVEGLAGRSEAIHLDLDRHVNIIWGLNGTGKSTLLKILHSALSNDAGLVVRLPVKKAMVEIVDEESDIILRRTLEYSGELEFSDESERSGEVKFSAGAPPDVSMFDDDMEGAPLGRRWVSDYPGVSDARGPRFRHSYLPISRMMEESRRRYVPSRYREPIDESFLDRVFMDQILELWKAYHAESIGRVRDIQQEGLGKILSVLFGGPKSSVSSSPEATDATQAYEMTRDFLASQRMPVTFNEESFVERFRSGQELQEVVARISDVRRRINEALRPQRDLEKLISTLYSGNKEISLSPRGIEVRVNGEEIPPYALSSGEKQVLLMLVNAIGSGSTSVIIDEPELSLHVDWQERLVESLSDLNPKCQLIFATHSPEIMANVDDQKIRRL